MQKSLEQIQSHATFSGTGVMESENHSEKNGVGHKNRFKNGLLSAVFLSVFVSASFAQDIIVTRDSKRINAKVTEVNIDNIRYKNFDNPDGPVYTMLKSDIVTILYQNGQLETFVTESQGASKSEKPVVSEKPAKYEKSAISEKPSPEYFYYFENNPAPLLAEMEKNNTELYMKYMFGEKNARIGNIFFWSGITISAFGTVFISLDNYGDTLIPGSIILSAGQVLIGIGIPPKVIGNGQKKGAIRNYCDQQYSAMPAKPHFQFNLYGNRVGLAYVF